MNTNISGRSMRFVVISCGFLTIVGSYFYWTHLRAPQTVRNTLTIAMMSGWAPFMSINNQAEFEGFDVAVAQELAKRLGKELVIKDLGSLAPTFIALEQGLVDLVMSGLDITDVRRERMAMIPYSGEDVKTFSLLFWQKIPANITCIEDLVAENATVCVEPGSVLESFLDSVVGLPQKSLSKLEEMVLDVRYGKSQAMLVEPRIGRRLMRMEPNLKLLSVRLPRSFQTFGLGIAARKNDTVMIKKIENIINAMRADGILRALEQQWQMEK